MTAPVQYPLGVTPEKVRAIHAYYTSHTKREYKLDARIEQGWISLLAAHTMEDVQVVVRYLQKRVREPNWRGPRHPGCLKLNLENLFHLQRFSDDLAEARSILGAHTASRQPVKATPPQSVDAEPQPEPTDEERKRRVAQLRELRETL